MTPITKEKSRRSKTRQNCPVESSENRIQLFSIVRSDGRTICQCSICSVSLPYCPRSPTYLATGSPCSRVVIHLFSMPLVGRPLVCLLRSQILFSLRVLFVTAHERPILRFSLSARGRPTKFQRRHPPGNLLIPSHPLHVRFAKK